MYTLLLYYTHEHVSICLKDFKRVIVAFFRRTARRRTPLLQQIVGATVCVCRYAVSVSFSIVFDSSTDLKSSLQIVAYGRGIDSSRRRLLCLQAMMDSEHAVVCVGLQHGRQSRHQDFDTC